MLDCSEGIAGPKSAMLLGDFGADVIKVEPPDGEAGRTRPGFSMWNRNKRGTVAELSDLQGQERVLMLSRDADVCVFSQPLSKLERAGLGPDRLFALNPGLVYLHLPAFTAHGRGSDFPESAGLLSAATGIAFEQYSFEDRPVDPVMPHLSYAQAIWGAVTALAALIERELSGKGQLVTVSGMHAALVMMTGTVTDLPAISRGVRPGGGHGPIPFFRLYECKDGEWLILAALTPAFYIKAFTILDVLEILADERLGGEPAAMALPANAGWVIERVAAAFRERTRDEWLGLFQAAGLPAGPARRREEWFDHEQVRAIGMHVALEDPDRGHLEMPGIAVNLSETPGRIRTPAPTLKGNHSEPPRWEARLGDGAHRRQIDRPSDGPLAGLRVLDLGMVIAGSFGGSLFAELGADVVKVEPPTGDSLRAFAPTWLGYNKGKRGVVIDLQRPEGREVFLRLVMTADVVIDNYRPGVLGRLGIDYDSLRQAKPDIIAVSVTGYGDAGPLRLEPGFDPVLQSGSGMMLAQGGVSGPAFLTLPVTDTPTALMATFGACVALLHRLRTGRGQRVSTSLAALSVFMQSDEMVRFEGRPLAASGSKDHPGAGPLDRFYQTANGWVRLLATSEADKERLGKQGFLKLESGSRSVQTDLGAAFAALSTAEAVERLQASGLAAVPANHSFRELFEGQELTEADAMAEIHLKKGNRIWAAGRYASFSRTELTRVTVPPGLGEHTREVLAAVGYGEAEMSALLASGVVVQGGPFAI